MARSYSREEVEEIFRRAALRTGSDGEPMLSRQDLVDAAHDAGIDADAIHRAAEEVETGLVIPEPLPSEDDAVAAWSARRRRRFVRHVLTWLTICTGLLVLNLLAGGVFWFQWPLAGWGILVALHAIGALSAPSPEQIAKVKERHRRKMQVAQKKRNAELKKLDAQRREHEKRRAKEERKQSRDRRQESATAFESAVEEGVAALMDAAARTLTEVARRSRPPERRETDFDRYVAQKKREQSGQRVPLRVDVQAEPQRVHFDPQEHDTEESDEESPRRVRR